MEVILLETIDALGRKGQIVKVKNGFARNFLFPERKAMRVTKDALNRLEALRKRFAVEEAALVKELQGIASAIEGLQVDLVLKATEEGHLFGSVSTSMLAKEFAARGLTVAERTILLEEPIKSVGTFTAVVRLHPDVVSRFTIVVDREGGMPVVEEPQTAPAAEGEAAEAPTEAES